MNFEEVADEIDKDHSNLGIDESNKFRKSGRHYLVSSGLEHGKELYSLYHHTCKKNIATEQCDITYDDCRDLSILILFNAVAFDNTSMEWVVVARVRLDTQASAGNALCFRKMFEMQVKVLNWT